MPKGIVNPNWLQLVQDYRRSDKTAKVWCAENQISYNTLTNWNKRLKKDKSANFSLSLPSSFVELENSSSDDSGVMLEVRDIKIHLKVKFDELVLRQCLNCLRGKKEC